MSSTNVFEKVAAAVCGTGVLGLLVGVVHASSKNKPLLTPVEQAVQFTDPQTRKTLTQTLLPMSRAAGTTPEMKQKIEVIFDAACMVQALAKHSQTLVLRLEYALVARHYFLNAQMASQDLDTIVYEDARRTDYFEIHDQLVALVQACKQAAEVVDDTLRRRFASAAPVADPLPPLSELGCTV